MNLKIVCLCGSGRFFKEFRAAELSETKAGNAVFSIVDCGQVTPEFHAILDAVHRRKIEASDEILVLNVGGYVGESTRSEIGYARSLGKRMRWLEEPNEHEETVNCKGCGKSIGMCSCDREIKHDHSCRCGTGNPTPHEIGYGGCVRLMTFTPMRYGTHATLGCQLWNVGELNPITDYTLRSQRGYHEHPCGCWSRTDGSENSIKA